MRKKIVPVLLIFVFAVGISSMSYAPSSYKTQFNTFYANKGIVTAGSPIDQCIMCILCHKLNTSPAIPSNETNPNPYGVLLETNGRNYGAVESVDSDNDGFNNLDEITAKPFKIRSRPISSSQQNQIK